MVTSQGRANERNYLCCNFFVFLLLYAKRKVAWFSFSMTNLQEKSDMTSFTPFKGSWMYGVYFTKLYHKKFVDTQTPCVHNKMRTGGETL